MREAPPSLVRNRAISVPNGFGVQNLPTGLCFTARAFEEGTLVQLGRLYQTRTDWHKQRPPVTV